MTTLQPISFTTQQTLNGRSWDSSKIVEDGWKKGIPPEISSAVLSSGLINISGNNFSNQAKTKYWAGIQDSEIGTVPEGLFVWSPGNAGAKYKIELDETPFGSKSLSIRAQQVEIGTLTFEFPQYVNQGYVECYCWHKLHVFNVDGEAESPQVKMLRMVEGAGASTMQALPLSTDWTINSDNENGTGVQLSARPEFGGGTAFYKKPGDRVEQEVYNRVCINYSIGDEYSAGGRVWKIGDVESFTSSNLTPPQHFSAPFTGEPPATSLFGEPLDMRSELTASVGLKRVALPYYHRSYQDTEIKIARFYASDSQERFVVSSSESAEGIRNTNSVTIPEKESGTENCIADMVIPSGFPAPPYYLYRINHDGIISNPMEITNA